MKIFSSKENPMLVERESIIVQADGIWGSASHPGAPFPRPGTQAAYTARSSYQAQKLRTSPGRSSTQAV